MKKMFLLMIGTLAVGLCATAQSPVHAVMDEEDGNVKLEIISPAQPVQETELEIKEREKRLRELADDMAYAKALNSMNRGYFVFVADNIQIGNTGYRHYDINNNCNFILVQDNDGIIQYALNTGHPGTNGLGGWTGKGRVGKRSIKCADNGDVNVHFNIISGTVNANIDITLFHNSKRAVAFIRGGVPITMYGEVLPYRDSKHK